MTTNRSRLHPLFDPQSEYRLATASCVWHDDGLRSVREFFHDKAREALRQDYRRGKVVNPEDWGLGRDLNQAVHSFLSLPDPSRKAPSRSQSETLPAGETPWYAIAASPAGSDPDQTTGLALLQIDFEGNEHHELRREPQLFTGANSLSCEGELIDQFVLEVPGLPRQRQCLAMIIEHSVVEHLGGLLDCGTKVSSAAWGAGALPVRSISSEDEARNTIVQSLHYTTLVPSDPSLRRHASRISLLLTLVPALQGISDSSGRFVQTVALDRRCPGLQSDTWVVLCLGPRESAAKHTD